jgi:hypothetical protein
MLLGASGHGADAARAAAWSPDGDAARPGPGAHRRPPRRRAGLGRCCPGRVAGPVPGALCRNPAPICAPTGPETGCGVKSFAWWAQLGSNQRPLACKASALPLSYAPSPRAPVFRVGNGCNRGQRTRSGSPEAAPAAPDLSRDRQLADPGRPARPPEDPGERRLYLLGQPGRLAETGLAAERADRRRLPGDRPARLAGLPDVTAVAALDLAEPPDQVRAQAHRAPVEFTHPVDGRLARRADEHLAVGPDPSFPGALPPVRVDLPCTTAIAGHSVPILPFPPDRGRPTSRAPPALSDTRRCHEPAVRGLPPSTARRHSCR